MSALKMIARAFWKFIKIVEKVVLAVVWIIIILNLFDLVKALLK